MTKIIGHRGASAILPENTMEGFRLAFEQQAPAIEFDVHLSKDNVPMIIHDATLQRTTNGKGYVRHFTAKELKKFNAGYFFDPEKNQTFPVRSQGMKIPSFEEMLEEFKTQELCVEIKESSEEIVHLVVKLIKKFKAEDRCIVGSKYHNVSVTMRNQYPGIQRFLSKREFVMNFLSFKEGVNPSDHDPGAVASMPLEACGLAFGNKDFIDYLHERKILAYYWTINNPLVMKELANREADAVMTDNPALAVKSISV